VNENTPKTSLANPVSQLTYTDTRAVMTCIHGPVRSHPLRAAAATPLLTPQCVQSRPQKIMDPDGNTFGALVLQVELYSRDTRFESRLQRLRLYRGFTQPLQGKWQNSNSVTARNFPPMSFPI
jgi:hypothetical protein